MRTAQYVLLVALSACAGAAPQSAITSAIETTPGSSTAPPTDSTTTPSVAEALSTTSSSPLEGNSSAGVSFTSEPASPDNTLPASKNEEENVINTGEQEDASQETQVAASEPTPAAPSVVERFPHAVLFGGACGGSIISDTWVLTAGHCTIFTSGSYVLAGTSSLYGDGQRVRTKRLVLHPRFTVGPYWVNAERFNISQVGARYDFMLVELAKPLKLDGKRVAVIPLPDQTALPPDQPAAFAGYGAEQHGGYMREAMREMQLTLPPSETCEKMQEFDAADMICTRGVSSEQPAACNGDSGSGLVADGRLVGVASWVEDDARLCRAGALVVFSRVTTARDWIRNVTGI